MSAIMSSETHVNPQEDNPIVTQLQKSISELLSEESSDGTSNDKPGLSFEDPIWKTKQSPSRNGSTGAVHKLHVKPSLPGADHTNKFPSLSTHQRSDNQLSAFQQLSLDRNQVVDKVGRTDDFGRNLPTMNNNSRTAQNVDVVHQRDRNQNLCPSDINQHHQQSIHSQNLIDHRNPSPNPLPPLDQYGIQVPQPLIRNNRSNGSRWGFMFDGETDSRFFKTRSDIHYVHDIHDFIFRLETYADRDNFPHARLNQIILDFVTGTAEDWLWVYIRKTPRATWQEIREALFSRFSSQDSDEEIRRTLQHKLQGVRESINIFILDGEALNNRLRNPMPEGELLRTIRHNMSPELQNATLHLDFCDIEELRSVCAKYERLWGRFRQLGNVPQRRPAFVNQLDYRDQYGVDQITNDMQHTNINSYQNAYEDEVNVSAILQRPPVRQLSGTQPPMAPSVICWNCRSPGHLYKDCLQRINNIFCFGCGRPNILRPQCVSCQNKYSVNQPSNAPRPGGTRSNVINRDPRQPMREDAASNTEPRTYR